MRVRFNAEKIKEISERRKRGEPRSHLYKQLINKNEGEKLAVVLLFIGLSPNSVSNMTELSKYKCKRINILEKENDSVLVYNKREPISEELKQKVKTRDEERCVMCGYQENLHFHHIIPVSRGGKNKLQNLALLCPSCHKYVHCGSYSSRTIYDDKEAFWDSIVRIK